MELLNVVGSIASIIGLFVTFYTLYKVTSLPTALRQHSRDRQLTELIDKVIRIPPMKQTIPDSTARELEALIRTIRLYYVSVLPFKQGPLRSLLDTLKGELKGQKQLNVVQHQLRLIRDEITIR